MARKDSIAFLWANWRLYTDPDQLNTLASLVKSQGSGIGFLILCAFPLLILISLLRSNRIDKRPDEDDNISVSTLTSGWFNW